MEPILAITDPEFWIADLGAWLAGWFEPAWQPWILALLKAVALVVGFATLFAIATILERKGLGRIQNRPGPNRVGPWGLFQPAADGIKMLTKEDIVPARADKTVHFLAPLAMLAPITLAFAVIPFGREMTALPLNAGLLFFFAAGAASELAAFMAGWSSRNKYSMLGAIRAIAQMISFELPLVVSTVAVVMMTGSMSLVEIAQWHILTPWGLAGFLIFFTAALAESNRSPFDLPEGESEIIGGFMTEYSGFKYAIFFMAEYFGMFAVSSLAVVLFLGAWSAPVSWLQFIPSYIWFGVKLMGLLFGFIWLRGTLPRLRADQLMSFSWKFLLPMSLINIVVAAGWHYTAGWSFPGAPGCRWLLGLACVGIPFLALAWGLGSRRGWRPRIYRYAE
jgi:NADH-quinone oxidoreductase subunit H